MNDFVMWMNDFNVNNTNELYISQRNFIALYKALEWPMD